MKIKYFIFLLILLLSVLSGCTSQNNEELTEIAKNGSLSSVSAESCVTENDQSKSYPESIVLNNDNAESETEAKDTAPDKEQSVVSKEEGTVTFSAEIPSWILEEIENSESLTIGQKMHCRVLNPI